jgi:hypothetical protein
VSRRASLPGAEELFRRTSAERAKQARSRTGTEEKKSTKLQVAKSSEPVPEPQQPQQKAPKHDEKVTFYCTSEDLMALEGARLRLRSEFSTSADRGRIVRAALAYMLEDFEARGEDSILLRLLDS